MLTSVTFNCWLQMGTFARLFTTVTLDMGRARLAHRATVRALGNRSTLLVDMLKWTVCRWHMVSSGLMTKLIVRYGI
jgi:hypothetical protein